MGLPENDWKLLNWGHLIVRILIEPPVLSHRGRRKQTAFTGSSGNGGPDESRVAENTRTEAWRHLRCWRGSWCQRPPFCYFQSKVMRDICCLYTSDWQTFSGKGQIVKDFCSVGHTALLQLFSSAMVVWKQLLIDNTNGVVVTVNLYLHRQGVGRVWSAGYRWLPGLQRTMSSRSSSRTPACLLSPFIWPSIQILWSHGFLTVYQPFPPSDKTLSYLRPELLSSSSLSHQAE